MMMVECKTSIQTKIYIMKIVDVRYKIERKDSSSMDTTSMTVHRWTNHRWTNHRSAKRQQGQGRVESKSKIALLIFTHNKTLNQTIVCSELLKLLNFSLNFPS